MPQVFHPWTTLALKLAALVAAATGFAVLAAWRWRVDFPHSQGSPVEQPIPFSHRHHVGDDGIDCRYCHTSVETSASAGLPDTRTCLTCHSQLFTDSPLLAPLHDSVRSGRPISWRRVHDLPDFVYFDHSAHVNHGVPCAACHDRMDRMPLTWRAASLEMQWCLECHRNPVPHLVPRAAVFDPVPPRLPKAERARLARVYGVDRRRDLTDCSTCHR